MNPYGRAPALQEGNFVICESTAILPYLEAEYTPPSEVAKWVERMLARPGAVQTAAEG